MLSRGMSFVHDEVEDAQIWIGANFWSRAGGPHMWRHYDRELVGAELAVLAEHHLNVTRSFFFWPDFMPAPKRLDEPALEHFADFLDAHVEHGMRTIPTFVVGHMSGQNWDPAWRAGRSVYADVSFVAQQAWFIRQLVRRFAGHSAVAGWLLTNEVPVYGGSAPRETVAAWAELLAESVRGAGGVQPVSLGDGAWGIEVSGQDSGFSLCDTAATFDFLGPHVYRAADDQTRQHLAAAWHCELCSTFDRPVVLEEFGVNSAFCSDQNAAVYYRQTLHNALLAGATGWIAWNNTDFDNLAEEEPYRHHAFEMRFGLTDVTGKPKAQLTELAAFAAMLADIDFANCRRSDSGVALIVSSFFDSHYPFTTDRDREELEPVLRQAYVSARLADIPPALVRESDGVPAGAELYIVTSTKQLLSTTWAQLTDLASGGATVYVSYSPGTTAVQRGLWHPDINAMFGVSHQLRYGLLDQLADDTLTMTFTRTFGPLAEGRSLTFPVGEAGNSRAFLPVEPTEAEVLAQDQAGRPALLRRPVGHGAIVLCTYPIELMTGYTADVNPSAVAVLYDALADVAGVARAVTVHAIDVAVDSLVHRDGHRWVWLVNHSPRKRTVTPVTAEGQMLRQLDGSGLPDEVTLEPFGVTVLRLDDRTR